MVFVFATSVVYHHDGHFCVWAVVLIAVKKKKKKIIWGRTKNIFRTKLIVKRNACNVKHCVLFPTGGVKNVFFKSKNTQERRRREKKKGKTPPGFEIECSNNYDRQCFSSAVAQNLPSCFTVCLRTEVTLCG